MMPFTAMNFQEDANFRKLTLNKYCQHVCLPMGVSHIMAFSQKEERLSLRIAKTPQGPTLTFRVHRFSLAKHVQRLQKRPINTNSLVSNPPIVVTNNFGDVSAPPQVKLMRITFQNMYPAINVASVKLKDCRRVVLFHLLDAENTTTATDEEGGGTTTTKHQRVEVRHYAIKAAPVGVNRKVRRLIQTKIPNLHNVQDIADYISGSANAYTNVDAASDSEPEDASAVVELPQNYAGRGNTRQNKSALKLVELGPRLCLELVKVEQGLGEGNVMYHAHVSKTPQEVQVIQEKKEREVQLKQQRKSVQEKNVERKRQSQEEKRQAKRQRREEREESAMDALRNNNNTNDNEEEEDDEENDFGDDGGGDSSGASVSDASGNQSDSDAEA
jgi:ribosome biogenesis protein SSF1/2